ncbi:MAG: hypothetical protein M3323_07955 [Actinomycetota bacterium]|nr:hypothetical protein [Actinomycetota bacterium]
MGNRAGVALRAVAVLCLASALLPAGPAALGRAQVGEDEDCFGIDPTITGTSGDDVIRGTHGFDVISALEGDDTVRGAAGTDFICAGDGDDRVHAGPGLDLIEALRGADVVFGEGGDDLFLETSLPEGSGGGAFVYVGDSSDDEFHGGPGDDLIGDDGANDLLDGGDGRDTFLGLFTFSPIVVDLTTGHTTSTRGDINTLSSIENAFGGIYADVIVGNEGPNVLSGIFGTDVVYGEGGADLLLATTSGAFLDGGSGGTRDGILVATNDAVEVDLEDGTVSPRGDSGSPDRIAGIEDVIGGRGDDLVTGSDLTNRLFGGGGDDVLDGAGGNDVIAGDGPFWPWVDRAHWDSASEEEWGADVLVGGDGRDRLDGGPADDECRSGEILRRCELVTREAAPGEAPGRGRCCTAPRLDTWWAPLVLDPAAQPWLDLVPARLRP